jgi:hypothetical protein
MWQAKPDRNASMEEPAIIIARRAGQDWPQQEAWLERLYPDLMTWYQAMPWWSLRPGPIPVIYRFIMDYQIRHWVAHVDGRLSAMLSWQGMPEQNDRLWAAVPPEGSEHVLTALLLNARHDLPWRQNLTLDFPAGEYYTSIEAAGFHPQRTLLWMKLKEENPVNHS